MIFTWPENILCGKKLRMPKVCCFSKMTLTTQLLWSSFQQRDYLNIILQSSTTVVVCFFLNIEFLLNFAFFSILYCLNPTSDTCISFCVRKKRRYLLSWKFLSCTMKDGHICSPLGTSCERVLVSVLLSERKNYF